MSGLTSIGHWLTIVRRSIFLLADIESSASRVGHIFSYYINRFAVHTAIVHMRATL
jgi:hypothetical protein